MTFERQRIRWMKDPLPGSCIEVSQQKAIDELEEIRGERNTKEDLHCTPAMHTRYRSLLGERTLFTEWNTVSVLLQVFQMWHSVADMPQERHVFVAALSFRASFLSALNNSPCTTPLTNTTSWRLKKRHRSFLGQNKLVAE